ncbi:hypothetical protein GQ43DRAFT_463061 [Delitschia confertaspora ATCC 74209]|uniref:Synaptobrevin n=1 Tax=Delitschia confertaspora ATCC 74209 TaxID=1513339 RepID=A0A9P4JNN4_9PLEO|nr:hypothetical protein GQ43DRAFT_463061 [Delitschia confertaspora ATCC 74209]
MSSRPHSPTEHPDITSISLNRLLSRLEQQVLSVDANPRLRTDNFERRKTANNIDHARTLLLKLEHDLTASSRSHTIKPAQKASLQTSLQQQRNLIKQLNQRLYELEQLDDEDSGSINSDDGTSDLFPSYAPYRQEEAGLESGGRADADGNAVLREAARGIESQLRARKAGAGSQNEDTATTTSSSLFGDRKANQDSGLPQTEALLSHNRTEQETLTSSLLQMAQQLKSSSLQFSSSLEADKSSLNRAIEGLDKNVMGMDAAGQRMGVLRRMTEGKGWWDRMKLYAIIFGLWVVAFLIFFVGPKIRF